MGQAGAPGWNYPTVFKALEFLLGSNEVAKQQGSPARRNTPQTLPSQARKSRQHSESQGRCPCTRPVNKPLAQNQEHPYSRAEHRVGPPGFYGLEGGKHLHSRMHTGAQAGANIPLSPPTPVLLWLTRGSRLGVTRHWSTLTIQPWALWEDLRRKV